VRPQGDEPTHTAEATDTEKVADAVRAAIKRHAESFPKGVSVARVTVTDGVATLDFSPEFNKLANMGDSTESHAQKHLRAAVAKFPGIEKMRVTVQGKPFDSQATDWTTPFPVRQSGEELDATAAGGSPVPGETAKRPSGGEQ
jgi:hypothetical protein